MQKLFTWKKILNLIINEVLGKFIGFVVGMWASKLFTHQVYEKKGVNNLFGLMKRKKITVNDTPEWVQWIIAALIGYIVLELISYFFEKKLYLKLLDFVKKKVGIQDDPSDTRKNLIQ